MRVFAPSAIEPNGDGAGMRVKSLRVGKRDRGTAERAQLVGTAFEDRRALHEIEHAKSGRKPRRARRRQDVIGAGNVIADRFRSVGAYEDSPGIADPSREP